MDCGGEPYPEHRTARTRLKRELDKELEIELSDDYTNHDSKTCLNCLAENDPYDEELYGKYVKG